MTQQEISLINGVATDLGVYIDWNMDVEKVPFLCIIALTKRLLYLESVIKSLGEKNDT